MARLRRRGRLYLGLENFRLCLGLLDVFWALGLQFSFFGGFFIRLFVRLWLSFLFEPAPLKVNLGDINVFCGLFRNRRLNVIRRRCIIGRLRGNFRRNIETIFPWGCHRGFFVIITSARMNIGQTAIGPFTLFR